MKFENKVVIVTGASSGIGEGVAKMFLEEGARLVGCGIEPAMKIESEKAIYVQADLTDPAQAQNVVDKAVEAFGQVDKLVGCAGVTFIGSLENTEYNTFEGTLHQPRRRVQHVQGRCERAGQERGPLHCHHRLRPGRAPHPRAHWLLPL